MLKVRPRDELLEKQIRPKTLCGGDHQEALVRSGATNKQRRVLIVRPPHVTLRVFLKAAGLRLKEETMSSAQGKSQAPSTHRHL